MLSYVQRELADIWKKNVIENLENENLSYTTVRKFLLDLKEEFERGDDETVKVVELKKVEQGGKTMKEFVQEFKRAARGSGYKE